MQLYQYCCVAATAASYIHMIKLFLVSLYTGIDSMLGALNAGAGAAATTCAHSKDYFLISWVVVQCVCAFSGFCARSWLWIFC